jgi:hypothetical protein
VGVVATALLLATAAGCVEATDETLDLPETGAPTELAPEAELVAAPVKRVFAPTRAGCATVAVYVEGTRAGAVCSEDVEREGLTVLDLSDTWTPRVFAVDPETGGAPEYRAKYLELAGQPSADLGLNGIAPRLSTLANRIKDDKRRACDAKVDVSPLAAVEAARAAASDDKARAAALKKATERDAVSAAQSQLVCAGLLKAGSVTGQLSGTTHAALEAFRRRNMIVGAGLDADTVYALSLGGEELAYRALLRGLRERVAEAGGLLEDGTALEQRELVVGRELDLTRFAPLVEEALPNGAPDLVDRATDRAARELGWTSPDGVRAFLDELGKDGLGKARVAVTLPSAPSYHGAQMELRVEIDRGDVFFDAPGQAAAAKRKLGTVRGPSFVVYAKDGEREVALMRWATTIGGWKKERTEDGELALKYKESDVGDRFWRQIIAAPAWMPPESTPETDLLHEDKEGNVSLKRDLIQPGYRNAYGLVMLIHHESVTKKGKQEWADHGIRTHGSVDYRSIKRGTSHGCHRLYNQLALRLSGFLLDHRAHARRGKLLTEYRRTLEWNEQIVEVEVPTRGYLYELDPPVPVHVLPGRVLGDAQKPMSSALSLPPDEPKKS